MDDRKKIAAAISAVLTYISTEEESPMDEPAPSVQPQQNLWGLSGRQAQMHLRTLISMKAFHGRKV